MGMQDPPTLIPKPKPTHMLPHRPLAIEAMIAGLLRRAEPNLVSSMVVVTAVESTLPWAQRVEIHKALVRMVNADRVKPHWLKGRTLPVYGLPNAIPAPPSPAS